MADTPEHGTGNLSRRGLIIGGGVAAAAAAGALAGAPALADTEPRGHDDEDDLLLVNGRIHTMDDRNTVVSAVRDPRRPVRRGRPRTPTAAARA